MAKNPFIICFDAPISAEQKAFIEDISDDFHEVFPHTFLVSVYSSLSSFRHLIDQEFRYVSHFTCQIQKGERYTFRPFDPSEPPELPESFGFRRETL